MFKRYWIFAVVLGLIAVSLQAQEQTNTSPDRGADQQKSADNLPLGFPIRIIEDGVTTRSRERREQQSEEREKDDLIAQQTMADATVAMNEATQSMKNASWLSFGAVAIGTVLLIWTLWLTKQANESAIKAVKITKDIGQSQSMAYVYMRGITWGVWPDISGKNCARFTFDVGNCGQTPCPRFEIRAAAMLYPLKVISDDRPDIKIKAMGWNALPADSNLTGPIPVEFIDSEEAIINRNPKSDMVLIYGEIRYSTIHGRQFVSEFEFMSKDMSTGGGSKYKCKKMSRSPKKCETFREIL